VLITFSLAHGCKNFKKKIKKLEKKHKELKGLSNRCSKAMHALIKNCQGSEHIFMKNMENKMNHYLGSHKKCKDPASESCKHLKSIDNKDAQTDFMVILKVNTLMFCSLNGISLQSCFISTNVLKLQMLLRDCTQLEENG
jgi:hypothetical protein